MKLKEILFGVGCFIVLCVVVVGPQLYFEVKDYKVVLINPTEGQVLNLYKSSSASERIWVREVHAVKGEDSLLEATIGVRTSDGGEDKVKEVLEELEFDYYVVGKVASR